MLELGEGLGPDGRAAPACGGGGATKTLVSEWQNISDLPTTNLLVAALQGRKEQQGHLNKR